MDFANAFSMNWPILALCAAALAVVFIVLKGSIAGIQRSLAELRERQEKLSSRVGELDRGFETTARQCADAVARISAAEREIAQYVDGHQAKDGADDDAPISIERFNAAAETLSQLARELDGFDTRQDENWLRIKGDLDEQGFQLQRVQQHVDRLFASAVADSHAQASAN